MALTWPEKDPDEVLDYQVDWSDELGTDTISTSAWTVPSGITKNSDTINGASTHTVIWISGGTAGTTYEFINRVVTAGGRTYDQTIRLRVREK